MKAKIEVKPVAWSGEKITKYEAFARYFSGKCITSGPQTTEHKAMLALNDELASWQKAIADMREAFKKTFKTE